MQIYTDNLDKDIRLKASYVLKSKNSSISQEVVKMLKKYAKEYDKMIENN